MWTLALALAAPLDDDAIDALIARDALAKDPIEEACCGEGGIGRSEVRWAELTGEPPEELVLTMQEYVGEGAATDHHHVYDLSGDAPVLIGTLSHGGYAVFPYLELTDLDRDGVQELFAVGPNSGESPSTLTLHRVVDGGLQPVGKTATQGQVYLPFDVDRDGLDDIVALATYDGRAAVEVLGRDGSPAVSPPVSRWLPALFAHALAAPELHRADTTLTLLRQAMEERSLAPTQPQASFEDVLTQVATGSDPFPWVHATWWQGTVAQRAKLQELLSDPERSQAAALLLLSTPGDRLAVDAWIHERLRDAAADVGPLPYDRLLAMLRPDERERVCGHVQELVLTEGSEEGRGQLAFAALAGPLWCIDAAVAVLEADDVPQQVRRGAVHAVDNSTFHPPAQASFFGRRRTVAPLLIRLLEGNDPVLAAEAARALRQVGEHGDVLRRALLTAVDPEVQRSVLVSLDALDAPGPAKVYLTVLQRSRNPEVRRRLHGQMARMTDPFDTQAGLEQVRSPTDYDAYRWRAMYRTDSVSPAHKAVYQVDAGSRLGDDDARIRQYAAQILQSLGLGPHADTLRTLAKDDPETWVREAAQDALDAHP